MQADTFCGLLQFKLLTCTSVTEFYNLVLVEGRWCPKARKVNVGMASHWPCVREFVVYITCKLKSPKTEGLAFRAQSHDSNTPSLPY